MKGISASRAKYAYDEFGNPLEIKVRGEILDFQGPHPNLPPEYLRMIEFAEVLSSGVDFVRVDFYLIDGQIYFSEMTNYPFGGNIEFLPKRFNKQVTKYWKRFDIFSFNKY